MGDNKLQSIGEIFNQKFFRIPDYQRGYAWNLDQLKDFWEDIGNLKENKIHYTGLLTVEAVKIKDIEKNSEKWSDDKWLIQKGLKPYFVIDGQQRLTTCIVLINSILNKIDKEDLINYQIKTYWYDKFLFQESNKYKSYLFGYEKDNPSDEFFKTKILNQTSLSADKFPEHTLYTINLKNAKDFFDEKIKAFTKDEVEAIFRKVINSLKFNFYEIDDDLDVFITFETMNNRGKPLSKLELLKNRLIYLTTLMDETIGDSERLRKDISETWKTIYEYLGKDSFKKLEDDNFLKDHWIMYFKYDRKESETYAKFLLNDYFTSKNLLTGQISFNDIQLYVESISKSVKNWFYTFNPAQSKYQEETKLWLERLNRVGFGAFRPLIMAVMTKETNEIKLNELLRLAESFVFLVFNLSRAPANTKDSYFYRMANSFYNGEKDHNIEDLIKNINNLIYNDSDKEFWLDLDQFAKHISKLFDRNEGFYSWNGLRYFLYEYELDCQTRARGDVKISWEEFNKRKKEDSIEHIYPQQAEIDCWNNDFSKFSGQERKWLLNSLGNLLLISQSKNSSLQNSCFSVKRKNGDIGYYNGSYSEIEVSQNTQWTPDEIKQRGLNLLKFLEERWDVDFESEEFKLKILHLDFFKNPDLN
jgi:uncharacterized protein with ParB-like and HNH nuclease domain